MPYPSAFVRQTLRWNLAGGEVANTSVSWRPDDAIVALDDDTVDAFGGIAHTFWGAVKGWYPASTAFVGTRVALVSSTGTTIDAQERPVSPEGGTRSSGPLPTEVACVVSLRTGSSTRRTRGRCYLPGLASAGLTGEARYDTTNTQAIADAFADMLADLVAAPSTTIWEPVVASKVGNLFTKVTQVAVGDVPDAQRRRRDALIEAYATATP